MDYHITTITKKYPDLIVSQGEFILEASSTFHFFSS